MGAIRGLPSRECRCLPLGFNFVHVEDEVGQRIPLRRWASTWSMSKTKLVRELGGGDGHGDAAGDAAPKGLSDPPSDRLLGGCELGMLPSGALLSEPIVCNWSSSMHVHCGF